MVEALIDLEKEKRRRKQIRENERQNNPTLIAKEKEIEYAIQEFWLFCVYMDPVFFDITKRPHLFEIARVFQKVETGELKKVMISLPPRAGKSYLTSMFCAWTFGKHPEDSIMRNSYGQDLANKFSYDVRAIIQLPKYLEIFPHIKLRSDKANIVDWALQTSKQSAYFCAGVGGAITGKGCNRLAILDDPIKNIEDALSETILNKTWQWYTSTHKSRIEKFCAEIHIATRWSSKDPIGKLKESQPGEWLEIVIPALDKNGKSFCEEVKTTEEYLELKKVQDDFIWEAEYMQNPVESKGLLFPMVSLKRFSLQEVSRLDVSNEEKWDAIVGYTDTADEGTDYLASLTGKIKGEFVYITDVVFTQEPIEITEPLVAQMIIDTNQNKHIVESNAGGKSFAVNVKKLITGSSKCYVQSIPQTKNKETRILMKSGQIKQYFFFRNDYEVGSDYDKYMKQLTSYVKLGNNSHDDAPDATTGLAENFLIKRELKAVQRPY